MFFPLTAAADFCYLRTYEKSDNLTAAAVDYEHELQLEEMDGNPINPTSMVLSKEESQ